MKNWYLHIVRLTVDTAHLLGKHNSGSSVVGSPDPRDSEAVEQTGEVALTTGYLELLLVDGIGVVVVSRSNDFVGSQAVHGSESFGNMAMFHQPTGRLGAEKDTEEKDEGRNEGGTELETPRDVAGVFDNDVGAETQENTCT
jgi:hypothetical protein